MKSILIIMLALLILPVVSANQMFIQNREAEWKISCSIDDAICSSSAVCNLNLNYPFNGSSIRNYTNLTNLNNGEFNVTFVADELSVLGSYCGSIFCVDGNYNGTESVCIDVTATGFEFTEPKAIFYIVLFAILIFFFIVDVMSISKLPRGNDTDEYGLIMGINRLKYLRPVLYVVAWCLLLGIVYTAFNISSVYLETQMFASLFFAIYRVMFILMLPMVIVWFIFLFVQIFRDGKVKRLLERGIEIGTAP